jgi:hypothetical protein
MGVPEGLAWFKKTFGDAVADGVKGTPFSVDLLAAVAVQETFEVWGGLFNTMPPAEILKVCVGDTLDAPNRSAFPKTKADLLAAPNGDQMFKIARAALEAVAVHSASYRAVANANPNKFCHGYGIFQYDIQFFQNDPDYFLKQQWFDFPTCLAKAIQELQNAKKRVYGANKNTLDDDEKVFVAIAYNCGRCDFSRGFKQGFQDGSGKFYGELIDQYMDISEQTVLA